MGAKMNELQQWAEERVKQHEEEAAKNIGWHAEHQKTEAKARLDESRIWLGQILKSLHRQA